MERSLFVALAAASALLTAFSLPANAQDYCAMNMASFIQLPDGSCVSTDYMSLRGLASDNLEAAAADFQEAADFYDATRRESRTDVVATPLTYSERSVENNFTDDDKEMAADYLYSTSDNLNLAVDSYSDIMTLTTPAELEAMNQVSGTMLGR